MVVVAQTDDPSPGVSLSLPDPIPQAYRDKIGSNFLADQGGGGFLQNWQMSKDKNDLKTFFHFYVKMDIDMPACRRVGFRQYVKKYRFIKRIDEDFKRMPRPKGQEEADPPPADNDPNFQAPGEVEQKPGGGFTFYDVPGMSMINSGMPEDVECDRLRLVFKTIIQCDPGPTVTIYWVAEFNVPYVDGDPQPKEAFGKVTEISEQDYNDAEKKFG